ncbi:hypothetical protein KOM00_07305 [Geomonas sp. Red69]|uniref:hypothetical protein n=1 Tax=Geomonas diazotrophica TaxID=2843197 RepID=UPI001C106405|nr:hypothetical protein [Geomonas diazotrophica]MBU5636542.1 hypothetical protein [Geomonas diazotrophica]
MEPKKIFANGWDVTEATIVVAAVIMTYLRVDGHYVILAFGSLSLVLGLEPLVKKQIYVRGKVYTRENNPTSYYSMVSVYLVTAAICFIVTAVV